MDWKLKEPGKYSFGSVLMITASRIDLKGSENRKDGRQGDYFQGHCSNPESAPGKR